MDVVPAADLGLQAPVNPHPHPNDNPFLSFESVVPAYMAMSALSILGGALITTLFCCVPKLRADHASRIILWITVCDMLYTLKFFVGTLFWTLGFQNPRASFHLIDDDCFTSAAYGNFWAMACISWNACWVYDFLSVLRNPLRNTRKNGRWYHAFVWGLACTTTAIVMATGGHVDSDNHTCWVRSYVTNMLVFDVPLYIFMAFAFLSLIIASQQLLWSGTRQSRDLRRRLCMRHGLYVLAFLILWTWPVVHYALDEDDEILWITVLDAIAASGQAFFLALIRLSEPGAWALFTAVLARKPCCGKPAPPVCARLCPCFEDPSALSAQGRSGRDPTGRRHRRHRHHRHRDDGAADHQDGSPGPDGGLLKDRSRSRRALVSGDSFFSRTAGPGSATNSYARLDDGPASGDGSAVGLPKALAAPSTREGRHSARAGVARAVTESGSDDSSSASEDGARDLALQQLEREERERRRRQQRRRQTMMLQLLNTYGAYSELSGSGEDGVTTTEDLRSPTLTSAEDRRQRRDRRQKRLQRAQLEGATAVDPFLGSSQSSEDAPARSSSGRGIELRDRGTSSGSGGSGGLPDARRAAASVSAHSFPRTSAPRQTDATYSPSPGPHSLSPSPPNSLAGSLGAAGRVVPLGPGASFSTTPEGLVRTALAGTSPSPGPPSIDDRGSTRSASPPVTLASPLVLERGSTLTFAVNPRASDAPARGPSSAVTHPADRLPAGVEFSLEGFRAQSRSSAGEAALRTRGLSSAGDLMTVAVGADGEEESTERTPIVLSSGAAYAYGTATTASSSSSSSSSSGLSSELPSSAAAAAMAASGAPAPPLLSRAVSASATLATFRIATDSPARPSTFVESLARYFRGNEEGAGSSSTSSEEEEKEKEKGDGTVDPAERERRRARRARIREKKERRRLAALTEGVTVENMNDAESDTSSDTSSGTTSSDSSHGSKHSGDSHHSTSSSSSSSSSSTSSSSSSSTDSFDDHPVTSTPRRLEGAVMPGRTVTWGSLNSPGGGAPPAVTPRSRRATGLPSSSSSASRIDRELSDQVVPTSRLGHGSPASSLASSPALSFAALAASSSSSSPSSSSSSVAVRARAGRGFSGRELAATTRAPFTSLVRSALVQPRSRSWDRGVGIEMLRRNIPRPERATAYLVTSSLQSANDESGVHDGAENVTDVPPSLGPSRTAVVSTLPQRNASAPLGTHGLVVSVDGAATLSRPPPPPPPPPPTTTTTSSTLAGRTLAPPPKPPSRATTHGVEEKVAARNSEEDDDAEERRDEVEEDDDLGFDDDDLWESDWDAVEEARFEAAARKGLTLPLRRPSTRKSQVAALRSALGGSARGSGVGGALAGETSGARPRSSAVGTASLTRMSLSGLARNAEPSSGWDVAAGLRAELGICMLSGMCQVLLQGEVDHSTGFLARRNHRRQQWLRRFGRLPPEESTTPRSSSTGMGVLGLASPTVPGLLPVAVSSSTLLSGVTESTLADATGVAVEASSTPRATAGEGGKGSSYVYRPLAPGARVRMADLLISPTSVRRRFGLLAGFSLTRFQRYVRQRHWDEDRRTVAALKRRHDGEPSREPSLAALLPDRSSTLPLSDSSSTALIGAGANHRVGTPELGALVASATAPAGAAMPLAAPAALSGVSPALRPSPSLAPFSALRPLSVPRQRPSPLGPTPIGAAPASPAFGPGTPVGLRRQRNMSSSYHPPAGTLRMLALASSRSMDEDGDGDDGDQFVGGSEDEDLVGGDDGDEDADDGGDDEVPEEDGADGGDEERKGGAGDGGGGKAVADDESSFVSRAASILKSVTAFVSEPPQPFDQDGTGDLRVPLLIEGGEAGESASLVAFDGGDRSAPSEDPGTTQTRAPAPPPRRPPPAPVSSSGAFLASSAASPSVSSATSSSASSTAEGLSSNGGAPAIGGTDLSLGGVAAASTGAAPKGSASRRRTSSRRRRSSVKDMFDFVAIEEARFAQIRALAGLSAVHLVRVFDPLLLRDGRLHAHFSDGASSSFFCRSLDESLVVKTIAGSEVESLVKLLPAYIHHLEENPDSLLCRFYGCFSLQPKGSDPVHFLLMGNVFPLVKVGPRATTFDLKGSTINRRARGPDAEAGSSARKGGASKEGRDRTSKREGGARTRKRSSRGARRGHGRADGDGSWRDDEDADDLDDELEDEEEDLSQSDLDDGSESGTESEHDDASVTEFDEDEDGDGDEDEDGDEEDGAGRRDGEGGRNGSEHEGGAARRGGRRKDGSRKSRGRSRRKGRGKGEKEKSGSRILFQDEDFRRDYPNGIPLERRLVGELTAQIQRDVTLLQSQGLMDYSLLIQIIPTVPDPSPTGTFHRTGAGAVGTGVGGSLSSGSSWNPIPRSKTEGAGPSASPALAGVGAGAASLQTLASIPLVPPISLTKPALLDVDPLAQLRIVGDGRSKGGGGRGASSSSNASSGDGRGGGGSAAGGGSGGGLTDSRALRLYQRLLMGVRVLQAGSTLPSSSSSSSSSSSYATALSALRSPTVPSPVARAAVGSFAPWSSLSVVPVPRSLVVEARTPVARYAPPTADAFSVVVDVSKPTSPGLPHGPPAASPASATLPSATARGRPSLSGVAHRSPLVHESTPAFARSQSSPLHVSATHGSLRAPEPVGELSPLVLTGESPRLLPVTGAALTTSATTAMVATSAAAAVPVPASAKPRMMLQVGIIDMLQTYDFGKKAENLVKSVLTFGRSYGETTIPGVEGAGGGGAGAGAGGSVAAGGGAGASAANGARSRPGRQSFFLGSFASLIGGGGAGGGGGADTPLLDADFTSSPPATPRLGAAGPRRVLTGISAVDPATYAVRFMGFVEDIFNGYSIKLD